MRMQVRIFKPSKSAMQSGRSKSNKWFLEYETISQRKSNDVMGWTESSDTLNQVTMKFDTMDEAINFAKKNDWSYIVTPEQKRKLKPRNYSDNFKYEEVK